MISDIFSVQNIQKLYGTNSIRSIQKSAYKSDSVGSGSSSDVEINDEALISKDGMDLYKKDKAENQDKKEKTDSSGHKVLSNDEKKQIAQLKQRDTEVKTHEQAHMSAGSGLILKPASYNYTKDPDGEKYANSGEVQLNVTKDKDPNDTIKKAEQIKKAALAPSDPSPQDMKVAQQSDQMIIEAKKELSDKKTK